MTLVFTEGFDAYKSGGAVSIAAVNKKWEFCNTNVAQNTGRGGNGHSINNNTGELISPTLTNQATWICGFSYNRFTTQNNYTLLKFKDLGTTQVQLRVNSSNLLEVTLGTGGVIGTGTTTITQSTWYFIEFKTTIHNSLGSIHVRINGTTQEISVTGVDTQVSANAYANKIELANTSTSAFYDDLYLCDSTGSTNNDFLGDIRIETIFPNGAGNSTTWTPLSGSNFSNVDEVAVDDDTTYVSTSTINNVDTYAYQDLSLVVVNVKGLTVNVVSRKDDAGNRSVAPVVRSGGTDYVGTTKKLYDTYIPAWQIYDQNPNTSADWTVTNVNGAEFGAKLIS